MGRKKLTAEEKEEKRQEVINKLRNLVDMVDEVNMMSMTIGMKRNIHKSINLSQVLVKPSKIVDYVNRRFNMNVAMKSRAREVVEARYIAMHLLKKFTTLSLKEIAMYTGVTDHATVIYGIKKMRDLMDVDIHTAHTIRQCEKDIYEYMQNIYQ